MTSGDNAVDMSRLELLLREHFARTDKQLSDMRADNAEFRAEMVRLQNDFAEKQNAKFDAFTQKTDAKFDAVNARFDRIEEQIAVMQSDITGLKHDVAGLYHWDYWLLSIILVVFAMPQIVAGIKSLFGAIAEGISLIVKAFRKEDKS